MKKLVSIFAAISIIASLPVFSAYAEDTPDLESLAMSLGADKDYLAVPNRCYPANDNNPVEYDYFIPISASDQMTTLESGVANYSDTSFGSSVLSVLAHNGIISANAVTENYVTTYNYESLSQINSLLLAKDAIYKYQNLLDNKDFNLYTEYLFKSQSLAQKADTLVSTAEKCMNEGKYFLIMYSSFRINQSYGENMAGRAASGQKAHSAVGIGVTDGSWTFNGKTYDKCILTLDSFNVDSTNDAFSEDTCIYINSETKEYYMPKIFASAETDVHIIAIDNDQLLSFGDTDVADNITSLDIAIDSISEVTYTDENGNEVVLNSDNDFLDYYHRYHNKSFLIKGSNFKINTASENSTDYINIGNKDYTLEFELEKADSEIFCNDDTVKFTRKDSWGITYRKPEDPLEFYLRIEPKDSITTYRITGETMDTSEFTKTDGGVIFSGGKVRFSASEYHEENIGNPDEDTYKQLYSLAFNSADKVFVQYNDDNSLKLFADLDNDGVFEHEVQKGDLNCDGRIDAVDATLVNEAYADLSTVNGLYKPSIYDIYISKEYADMDSDGNINAVDASAILEIYAENSTK